MHLGFLGICRRHLDRNLFVFVTPVPSAETSRFANRNAWARGFKTSRKILGRFFLPRPIP